MLEVFVFSIKMMFKNKTRSFLTMLGIIIGILSLILIIVFGRSFAATFQSVTDSLFKNDQLMVTIVPTEENKNVVYDEYGVAIIPEGVRLDIREVDKQIKTISAESYVKVGGIINQLSSGEHLGKSLKFTLDSTTSNELMLMGYSLIQGRDITEADESYKAAVGVISDAAAKYLFKGEDPVGQSLNLSVGDNIAPIIIVGVYQERGAGTENIEESPTLLFVNRTFIEDEFVNALDSSYWERDSVNITMKGITDKAAFKQDVLASVSSAFHYDKWTLDAYSLSESVGTTNAIIGIILKIVFVIAAISLVIGGIGIMNVMLITVTERTNEIGVRKALGADNLVIIYQFLCESFVLSLSGTIIGVILGFLLSKLLALVAGSILRSNLHMPVTIDVSMPLSVILLAVLFSLIIGVIFGLYPAMKAVRMQVVDALRYE